MASVVWSLTAQLDLQQILVYLSELSEPVAQEFAERIQNATRQLEDFPLMGRIVPELTEQTMREVILAPYRMVYSVESEDMLRILRVIDSRRDLRRTLRLR